MGASLRILSDDAILSSHGSDRRVVTEFLIESGSSSQEHSRGGRQHSHLAHAEWDAFVGCCPHGYHEQLSGYAEHRANFGFGCQRIIIRDQGLNGRIIGGVQMLTRRSPLGLLASVQRGPLAEGDDPVVFEKVVERINGIARQLRFASLRVDLLPTQTAARQALLSAGFRPSRAWSAGQKSLTVRLEGSDEELLMRLPPKTRNAIRRAQRERVEVEEIGEADFDDFYRLRQMSVDHHHSLSLPRSFYWQMWRAFAPSGRSRVLVARSGTTPVATVWHLTDGDHLYYLVAGVHRGQAERKLMAGYLLQYHAMRWGRDQGCKLYDLLGVSDFKKKFAQQEVLWPDSLRQCYGPAARLRLAIFERLWSHPLGQRVVKRLARRWGLQPRMPW